MQDAQEVMGMLVKVQNEQGDMEPDDPQVRTKVESLIMVELRNKIIICQNRGGLIVEVGVLLRCTMVILT